MAKKKTQSKPIAGQTKPEAEKAPAMGPTTWLPYALTIGAFVFYWIYSTISTGFYQHDEIGHFFSMRGFWDDPASIMGNWAKTGYKLVFVLPALMGSNFLIFFNCLLASLTALIAYRIAEALKLKNPWLAFVLVAMQPFWIELSFRNYADSFSGLILILGIYFLVKEKLFSAALVLSFATLVRQEFFLVSGPLGLFWLFQRRWVPAFSLAIFPLLYNFAGYYFFDDPLYLYTSVTETSGLYADVFGKHGFFHFFRMSSVVFGSVVPLLFAGGIFWLIIKSVQQKSLVTTPFPIWFGFFAVSVYFILHGLFNVPGLNFAASPNLRYMNAVGPTAALLGVWFLNEWNNFSTKPKWFLAVAGVLTLLMAVNSSFKNNGVVFTDEKDWLPVLMFIAAGIALWVLSAKNQTIALLVLSILSGLYFLRPRKIGPEELAMKSIAQTVLKSKGPESPVFTNHLMYRYWVEKTTGELPKNVNGHDSTAISNSPAGTAIIWETHYSNRKDFPSIAIEFLGNKPDTFQYVNQVVSTDQRFQAVVFVKVK